jgi:hypothetical protein|tara:strand:+ start:67 stop:207 length:141 start_codon:yes stop_codon:yes gene_type:complete
MHRCLKVTKPFNFCARSSMATDSLAPSLVDDLKAERTGVLALMVIN